MLKKILLFGLFAALLPVALCGEKNVPQEEQIKEFTKAYAIGMFTEFNHDITEDLKVPDSVRFPYQDTSEMIEKWMKHYRFIEADTEIDRSWYERAAKMLAYMAECKQFLVLFGRKSEKDKSPQYQKVLANLKEAHKRFAELVKNPTPVEHNKLERLRAEKAKWEAQHHREKEKKAGIANPE